ncbi:MAG: putative Fe-S cluster assembly protein SufT [Terriglobales bacterium]
MEKQVVLVKRDIKVITIPYGTKITLYAGSQVIVAQGFGGSYTVLTDQGMMVRVEAKDADAIGETPIVPQPTQSAPTGPFDEKLVWEQLKTVYDPEIPVNIVDLGLIYHCEAKPVPGDDQGKRVEIKMTMTAPGCGMGEVLKQDVERKISGLPGVREVSVEVVFDPPWDLSRMSESARLQLGLM